MKRVPWVGCRCSAEGVCRMGKPFSRRFRCQGCRRMVPWCFGAADGMPEHCDDCWTVAT